MLEATVRKISRELCYFIDNGVSIARAFDLLEATFATPGELVAINTLREAYLESETV